MIEDLKYFINENKEAIYELGVIYVIMIIIFVIYYMLYSMGVINVN